MRTTQTAIFGKSGQTLLHRLHSARPTAVTFSVFKSSEDDDGTAEFTGTATIDTFTEAVSAASGDSEDNPKKLNLADTSGCVAGRLYRLSEAQMVEWVEPLEVQSDHVILRSALKNDYTTSGVIESTYVTVAVDNTWAADEDNLSTLAGHNPLWRVRLAATVAGAVEYDYFGFDLIRTPTRHGVTLSDLVLRWHGLESQLPEDMKSDRLQGFLDRAVWPALISDLAEIGKNEQQLRENHSLDEAVILRALRMLAENGLHPRAFELVDYVTLTRENFDRYMEKNFRVVSPHAESRGAGSGASTHAHEPFFPR